MTWLNISVEVQQHFAPYYSSGPCGNVLFPFGDEQEIYGPGLHRVPTTDALWIAGELDDPGVTTVIIGNSAMESIAFLSARRHQFKDLRRLLFISTGAGLSSPQLSSIRECCGVKSCALLFGGDLLGRIAQLKAAAFLRGMPLTVALNGHEEVWVEFRCRKFVFPSKTLTLHALENASGFRFKVRTYTPKVGRNYLEHSRHLSIKS